MNERIDDKADECSRVHDDRLLQLFEAPKQKRGRERQQNGRPVDNGTPRNDDYRAGD